MGYLHTRRRKPEISPLCPILCFRTPPTPTILSTALFKCSCLSCKEKVPRCDRPQAARFRSVRLPARRCMPALHLVLDNYLIKVITQYVILKHIHSSVCIFKQRFAILLTSSHLSRSEMHCNEQMFIDTETDSAKYHLHKRTGLR